MATLSTVHTPTSTRPSYAPTISHTSVLLGGGLIAGPLFIAASFVQALTRDGFDLKRHAISMLLLGDNGWMQVANFEITGLLVLACAIGIGRSLQRGRTAMLGALLFGGYGLGLVVAGVFPPDPGLGFPTGAPPDMPTAMTSHAMLHTVGFFVSFISLIAACVVFARIFRQRGWRGWSRYSVATALVPLPFITVSLALGGSGVPLFIMGVITSAWVAAVPLRLLAHAQEAVL